MFTLKEIITLLLFIFLVNVSIVILVFVINIFHPGSTAFVFPATLFIPIFTIVGFVTSLFVISILRLLKRAIRYLTQKAFKEIK